MATAGAAPLPDQPAASLPRQQTRRWHSRRPRQQRVSTMPASQELEDPEVPPSGNRLTAGGEREPPRPNQSVPEQQPSFPVEVRTGPATADGSFRARGNRSQRSRGAPRQRPGRYSATGTPTTTPQSADSYMSDASRRFGVSGRRFGGHLTPASTHARNASTIASSLHADAPEFHPQSSKSTHLMDRTRGGTRVTTRNGRGGIHRPRSTSKSSAPDLTTRIHEDIANGVYECPICTNEIGGNSRIWHCKTCWTVFHLSCVKKWSENEGSAHVERAGADDLPPPKKWRCPGCNLPKDTLPTTYTCWCGKDSEPRSVPGLPPHSCGQTCGKSREHPRKCPHPCELICHAGPCPPCTHMGPTQVCFCGRESVTKKCVDTAYGEGWSCDKPCGHIMPCGEHECPRKCHSGLCGACEVGVEAQCYCGKVEKVIPCHERSQERQSQETVCEGEEQTLHSWTGSFTCQNPCGRMFDCGKHACEQGCHVRHAKPAHCPRSPDVVSHCPCGKTAITDLQATGRMSCEESIPSCDKTCLRSLSCGHRCMQLCHGGNCPPCVQESSVACRCGRTKTSIICHEGSNEVPQCTRVCKVTLNCGRHECSTKCCAGERRAVDRQSSRRKHRPLEAGAPLLDEGFEAEHICTRICGRVLKCGNHSCPELCHKGPCGTCREAIFDELPCHCGRTVLQPPLPCGTKSPPCRFDCERPKSCGHPQVTHNCHGDDEACPKCPFLTEKLCTCGKKRLKNQPCWRTDVSCGEVCGKLLRCGSHQCRKTCHGAAECEDSSRPCQQTCGKPKRACQHPCEDPCHAPYACREERSCQRKILVTCRCQHIKKEMRCNASKASEGNQKEILSCDDECARLERNRKLALALDINPDTHQDEHVPYSKETLEMYSANAKWAQTQERLFRVFAADESEKRLRFKPMPAHQRAFLRALAEDFGFDSESLDPEPHRHVFVFKTPKFVMAPMKTLSQCAELRSNAGPSVSTVSHQRLATTSSNSSSYRHFNAFLLTEARFGLTIEELQVQLRELFDSNPKLAFDIEFLPSEEVAIKAHSGSGSGLDEKAVEASLRPLKGPLGAIIQAKSLAATVVLCHVDSSLNILQREVEGGGGGGGGGGSGSTEGGWSMVAAKAAAPRSLVKEKGAMGEKSVFTVLGSRVREKKMMTKKKKKEDEDDMDEEVEVKKMVAAATAEAAVVADDWEKAAEEEELREMMSGDAGGVSLDVTSGGREVVREKGGEMKSEEEQGGM